MKKSEIIIYTDGSSLGNPGPGGWGAVVLFPDTKVIELGGVEKDSTNNRMEMTAVIEALKKIQTLLHQGYEGQEKGVDPNRIMIHTDSSYVLNGITMWIYAWVKNDWKTKTKEDVLNKDLWEVLYKIENNLKHKYEIEWIKVAGHAGVLLNERCDQIATEFAACKRPLLFTGDFKDYEKLILSVLKDIKKPAVKKNKIKSSKKAYAYISAVDGKVFSDKTWPECEKRVKGKKGVKYKKVYSKEEEQELIGLWSLKSLL